MTSYQSAGVVVVQIDERCSQALALQSLSSVDELLRKRDAVAYVLRAAGPAEVLTAPPVLVTLATAAAQLTHAARARHRVRHACRADGVNERRLARTCRPQNRNQTNVMSMGVQTCSYCFVGYALFQTVVHESCHFGCANALMAWSM